MLQSRSGNGVLSGSRSLFLEGNLGGFSYFSGDFSAFNGASTDTPPSSTDERK
jgi:hypothetical protein